MMTKKREVKYPDLKGLMSSNGYKQKDMVEMMEERGVKLTASGLSMKLSGNRDFKINEMKVISEILDESPINLFFNTKYTKRVRELQNA